MPASKWMKESNSTQKNMQHPMELFVLFLRRFVKGVHICLDWRERRIGVDIWVYDDVIIVVGNGESKDEFDKSWEKMEKYIVWIECEFGDIFGIVSFGV